MSCSGLFPPKKTPMFDLFSYSVLLIVGWSAVSTAYGIVFSIWASLYSEFDASISGEIIVIYPRFDWNIRIIFTVVIFIQILPIIGHSFPSTVTTRYWIVHMIALLYPIGRMAISSFCFAVYIPHNLPYPRRDMIHKRNMTSEYQCGRETLPLLPPSLVCAPNGLYP